MLAWAKLGRYYDDLSQSDVYVPEIRRKIDSPGKDAFYITRYALDGSVFYGDPSERMNGTFLHETGHYHDFNFGKSREEFKRCQELVASAATENEMHVAEKRYGNWEDRSWEKAAMAFEATHKSTRVVTFEPRIPEPQPPRDISHLTLDPKLLALMRQDGIEI
jgi:hypothetical protein